VYYIDIQLAHLNVPQFRDRLWCYPVRKDVADQMGGIPLQRPQLEEPPQIGRFLLQNIAHYTTVAKMTDVNVDTSQVHQKFKPHLVGTVTLDDPDSV